MEYNQISNFIQQYGYWVLYPLAIVEGPVVTLIGGGLSALGLMKVWLVFLISVLGDLTMDILLYYFGFFGNKRLHRFTKKHSRLEKRRLLVRKFFKKHGGKVIFLVKISTGLCYITFITAGMIRMPLKRFLFFSFLGGILWSAFLVALGYFYGNLYKKIGEHIRLAGIIIFAMGLITLGVISYLKNRETKKIIQKHG